MCIAVNRILHIHAWVLAALLVTVLGMLALLVALERVHAGDVAYIAHMHRPIILVPAGLPPAIST
jgi:hypothetical protein